MATASIIEEIVLQMRNSTTLMVSIGMRYYSTAADYRFMRGAAAWEPTTVLKNYIASTGYEVVAQVDDRADLLTFEVDGVRIETGGAFLASSNGLDNVVVRSEAVADGRVFVDNLIVCNLDVDAVAKSLSGGWADLDDASLATPSETPAANYRIPVIDLPAGVVY